MNDQLQRFIFDEADIRGELVRLDQSYKDTLAAHHYPEPVSRLLGEFLAAAVLLSATLKFEGSLVLQAYSDGEIPLIMAEASSDHKIRAIARNADNASSTDFHTLLAKGKLSITIDPRQGKRYQGIVSLEGSNLSQCIENYFRQSEQLSTRVWLASDGQPAAGMLLQELPASDPIDQEQRDIDWEHATKLAETLTPDEMLSLPFEQLLFRLFHQEKVRLFPPALLSFECSCSETRTLEAMRAFGQQELEKILQEQGAIDINCEFCHQHYHFGSKDIDRLFEKNLH